MYWFYSPDYDYGRHLPISQLHGFLLNKPSAIRRLLIERHGISPDLFLPPSPADVITDADISRVHTPAVEQGLHSSAYIARVIEVPVLRWLPAPFLGSQLVTPQRAACAGTFAALRAALGGDWAFNLSGGFHHARPNLSHGFCLINDIAIALARLRSQLEKESPARRVLILDLDLHQGDGNSAAFADDPNTFTASIHQESAFPHPKIPSDLDIGLPDATTEDQYLTHLTNALDTIRSRFSPEVIVYVAGVDPFQDDPMSALGLSAAGLVARDVLVARFACDQKASLVVLPAGGYCPQSPLIHADGFVAIAAQHPTYKHLIVR